MRIEAKTNSNDDLVLEHFQEELDYIRNVEGNNNYGKEFVLLKKLLT